MGWPICGQYASTREFARVCEEFAAGSGTIGTIGHRHRRERRASLDSLENRPRHPPGLGGGVGVGRSCGTRCYAQAPSVESPVSRLQGASFRTPTPHLCRCCAGERPTDSLIATHERHELSPVPLACVHTPAPTLPPWRAVPLRHSTRGVEPHRRTERPSSRLPPRSIKKQAAPRPRLKHAAPKTCRGAPRPLS